MCYLYLFLVRVWFLDWGVVCKFWGLKKEIIKDLIVIIVKINWE